MKNTNFTNKLEQLHGKISRKDMFYNRFSIEAAIATSALMKSLPCVMKRKKLIELYHRTQDINTFLKESSTEKKIAFKWISLQNKLITNIIVSYLFIVTVYILYPVLYRGDAFPLASSIIPKVFHKQPWKAFVFIFEFYIGYMRLITVMSCDIQLVIYMCQLCSELQIVGNSMLAIDVNDKQSIMRAIQKHKRILEYGQVICREFSEPIVLQHCGMSIAAAFSAISVLYTKEQALLFEFVFIGVLIVAEILLLCFVGETIVQESLKIADILENKYEAFLDDTASMKTISFMLLRAQRPINLRVGTNTIVNLNLFRLTMNKIVSCFLILKRAMAE